MEGKTTDFSISKYTFNKDHLSSLTNESFAKTLYPIVYIIFDTNTSIAYVGETTNVIMRMSNHLTNRDKARLRNVYLISSPYFNKSATLDIESNLIKYMSADGSFKLLNGNTGVSEHNYYQKPLYFEIFSNIWNTLKLERVVRKDILTINNSDLFKYSPYKSLTTDQHLAIIDILKILIRNDNSMTFIKGSAGTGKTILAIYLMKLLLTDYEVDDISELEGETLKQIELVNELKNLKDLKIGFVVPMTSLRSTLKNVFGTIQGFKKSMVLGTSDVLKDEYDLLIVDEAHRLRKRVGITNYKSFDDNNRSLGLGNEGTELDWIIRSSKHQIFFYDDAQSIRPSDIDKSVFDNYINNPYNTKLELKSQLRALGGDDYILFVDSLFKMTLPTEQKPFKSPNYELVIYNDFSNLVNDLKDKNSKFGLARMISGYGWEWISRKTNEPDAQIDGIDLYWNRVASDWINSTNDVNEMGCIHTTQGYDLNYAGIIISKEIKLNPITNEIEIDIKNYYDTKGYVGIRDVNVLKDYIINIYKTLLYRGIRGTYLYICDENLKAYFSKYIEVK